MSEQEIAGPLDVLLRVGDKLRLFGGWWIVDMVNESRARCRALSTKHVKMNVAATGETVEFDKRGATYTSIANKVSLCAGETMQRTGRAGLQNFLAGQRPAPARSQQQGQNNEQQTKGQDSMNNSKARGGLAADAAADKAKTNGKGGKGKGRGKASAAKAADGKPSRADFMNKLFTGEFTKHEIAEKTISEFGGKPDSVLKAVNDRPFHMRKAGLKPEWKEVPKVEAKKAAAAA